jgi:hypothetical protein
MLNLMTEIEYVLVLLQNNYRYHFIYNIFSVWESRQFELLELFPLMVFSVK